MWQKPHISCWYRYNYFLPPSRKFCWSVCHSTTSEPIQKHSQPKINPRHTQMAMVIKGAEFIERGELSSQILLPAILLLFLLSVPTFLQDAKLQRTNICNCKRHRFILDISQDFRQLQRKCVNWGVSLNSQETDRQHSCCQYKHAIYKM